METKEKINIRHKALKELIKTREIEDQQTLIDLIKQEYGIDVSQAVISRDLRALGIGKRAIKNTMAYELQDTDASKEILRLAIVDITYNESLIIIHTLPGIAAFVGDYLDACQNLDLAGTIAGENAIFAAPKSIKNIKQTFAKLCTVLYFKKMMETP